jgi:ssRNA-specific RNase YbeY (16S rRNA maturation enzyme)
MKKITGACSAFAFAVLLNTACSKTNDSVNNTQGITDEIRSMVSAAGFNPNDVREEAGGYLIEGDILLSKTQLQEMATSYGPNLIVANAEHYRTSNLVTGLPRTLTVRLDIAGTKFSNALNTAINRYNNQNLRITLRRVSSGSANLPITSFNEGPNNGIITLGRANGFPSNGNPGAGFSLNVNSQAYGRSDVTENHLATVIAHEIGHCIGFRHTDYANRAFSCGSGGNEGQGTAGAIYIPGTPSASNGDSSSWMLACISFPTGNRPFNSNDRTALNFLY